MPKTREVLTKAVAADRLGLSVRRLMELSADDDSPLRRVREIDPATKREAVMFWADEIEAFKRELAIRPAPGVAAPDRPRLSIGEPARPRLLIGEPAAAPALELEPAGDRLRPWLTLAESADYSGLPASILRAMIEAGELPALDVGPRPGGHWRVRRLDLDAIEGEKQT